MDLKGKTVFITGSAQGVGKAVAEAVLKKGSKVCIADYDDKTGEAACEEFRSLFGADSVMFTKCDVSNQEQFESSFKAAISRFGNIDVMINNAGILNEKQLERCININFTGVVRGTMLALDHMRRDMGGAGGIIINVASTAGLGPGYWLPVYAGTKSAVVNFTLSWARNPKITDAEVKLAAICPSGVATPMFKDIGEDQLYDKDNFQKIAKENGFCEMPVVCDAFIKTIESAEANGRLCMVTAKQGIQVIKRTIVPDDTTTL